MVFVRHGSCTRGCCDRAIGIQPGILLPVPYQDMRLEQSGGVKLLGQCSLAGNGGNQNCEGRLRLLASKRFGN
jgi:hypothetical protein